MSPALIAAAALTFSHAHNAITVYERLYWKGRPVAVHVTDCRRHSRTQISCVAEARSPELLLCTTDWATALKHGIIRVHPGQFEEFAGEVQSLSCPLAGR